MAETLRERLERIKQNAYSEMFNVQSHKDIIKKAIKARFPSIPERANDNLAGKLLDLDNDEILQMGRDQIKVGDLIMDIVDIIGDFMSDMDNQDLK